MKAKSSVGKCKLTGNPGPFVKSHIIPEALTETVWRDQPLTQRDQNGRYIKRWSSWYDKKIVTADGKSILSGYDNWAIDFFRRHKLIWSSWGPMIRLQTSDHTEILDGGGVRAIEDVDCKRLRLFFLSLLWRAAVTDLFEFEGILLPEEELARLREMVLHGSAEPYNFYPLTLIQLSTIGFPHNRSACRQVKREPALDPDTKQLTGSYREEFQSTNSILMGSSRIFISTKMKSASPRVSLLDPETNSLSRQSQPKTRQR